jgi:hypothetical protein
MTLIVRLIPNQRCAGCSGISYVDQKSLLCCYCFGLALAVADRKRKLNRKLNWTLWQKLSRRVAMRFEKVAGQS